MPTLKLSRTLLLMLSLLAPVRLLAEDTPAVTVPPGKEPYTINLPGVADRALVGRRVDIYVRRVSDSKRLQDDYKKVLSNTLVLEANEGERKAKVAVDERAIRRLQKYEKPGYDFVLRSRDAL